ncbi:alpha-1,2-fucosyltransferase [Pseudomonadota bacterium]|nr:alpha-1,2-fucosyltransferase [Pseudomonadota bacterium]
MIIIKLQGGLGNQMFQFAFAYNLQKKWGVEVKFDLSWFKNQKVYTHVLLEEVFNIDLNIANKKEISEMIGWRKFRLINKVFNLVNFTSKSYIKEDINKDYVKITNDLDLKYYEGYWQNWNYFDEYKKELNKIFTFNNNINNTYKYWAQSIIESNSVCIHLRRGDYFKEKKNESIFHELKSNYFNQAINIIEKENKNLKYFIFSDDITFAKKLFIKKNNFFYIDCNQGSESFRDMQLMSLSKYIIISNSTFSWWAAWLNYEKKNKIIAPKFWFKNKFPAHKYYLPSWHII